MTEIDELIVYYGNPETYECTGFVILKENENWRLFHDQSYTEGTKYYVENVKIH